MKDVEFATLEKFLDYSVEELSGDTFALSPTVSVFVDSDGEANVVDGFTTFQFLTEN
jgi:hypothetical protein